MWRLYFEVCDFLAGLLPVRKWREKIRKTELYDYRKKFNALRKIISPAEFKHVRVIKGGWNIGFIINNKYVCKIRKYYDKDIKTLDYSKENSKKSMIISLKMKSFPL